MKNRKKKKEETDKFDFSKAMEGIDLEDFNNFANSFLNIMASAGDRTAKIMIVRREILDLLSNHELFDNMMNAKRNDDEKIIEKHLDFYMQLKCEIINFTNEIKGETE